MLKWWLWGQTSGDMNHLCRSICTRMFGLAETKHRFLIRVSYMQFSILPTWGARLHRSGWKAHWIEHVNAVTGFLWPTPLVLSTTGDGNEMCQKYWPVLLLLRWILWCVKNLFYKLLPSVEWYFSRNPTSWFFCQKLSYFFWKNPMPGNLMKFVFNFK